MTHWSSLPAMPQITLSASCQGGFWDAIWCFDFPLSALQNLWLTNVHINCCHVFSHFPASVKEPATPISYCTLWRSLLSNWQSVRLFGSLIPGLAKCQTHHLTWAGSLTHRGFFCFACLLSFNVKTGRALSEISGNDDKTMTEGEAGGKFLPGRESVGDWIGPDKPGLGDDLGQM